MIEDFKIREHIKKNVINSGVSKVMIEETSKMFCNNLSILIHNLLLVKKGSDIDQFLKEPTVKKYIK